MRYSGECGVARPEIFNEIPSCEGPLKDGQLNADDLKLFFDQGFIMIESFFKDEELEEVKSTIDGLVDEIALKLYKAGKITDLYKEYDFLNRLTKLEKEFPGASIILHKTGTMPDSFRKLWSNKKLLDLAEQILGTKNIGGHPVWNLRTKVPNTDAAVVPWHQDSAYLDNTSYDVFQLTAWIPLIDSNYQNGGMQVVKNGHKTGKVARHIGCWEDTWYLMLPEEEIEKVLGCDLKKDIVTCDVPYKGLLIFSNVIPHRSVPNASSNIRWSLDLRWQDFNKPNGFFGLKECLKMRTSDGNCDIDWNYFDAINRHGKQDENCRKDDAKDEFDTIISGPWMRSWEMTHTNKHTKALEDKDETFQFNPNDFIVG